ncbi:hypothetical protein HMPREF9714_02696 [Myroides odoratimimus CCUG 12901]|uniref:Uncharacterized protein n=2 Tax=Myroides odoratimimus TaxID=76832 RepID=A0ABN0EAA1_9FLAO|nr:hypothetical protein HMPREF9714_02696 [Myroides odoratimimus CCUG 12901]EHO07947.1 hypothetical protein HMPREF9715_02813 [Myroides odoratimimus CIP 101113]EHO09328.1 hypothetical protein HMPREF9712_01835 [Myroides odoratimimus CCUG 10230]EKB05158.1 hypothetical protein HMPREF9711_01424 [Myroides odoratimimus CCUG 3837]EPH13972.1 hypothetical protein HMPREF9713_00171 [Myroides odoratimimus CCUG 12700]SHL41601.1 hypothetical protein SAMN05444275_10460 [Myroides odoratimimus subsp. xuanwuensis
MYVVNIEKSFVFNNFFEPLIGFIGILFYNKL